MLVSNCGEHLSLNDSPCNLASINLLALWLWSNALVNNFCANTAQVIDIMALAQDIIVDVSDYPTQKIKDAARNLRTIGLGYANLGGLLMYKGFPYDSTDARVWAACLTSFMTSRTYLRSAEIATTKGAFPEFNKNKDAMLGVLGKHLTAHKQIHMDKLTKQNGVLIHMWGEAKAQWENVLERGKKHGFANSQTNVIAPTGTIAFFMDAETTGCEPVLSLKTHKALAGGGYLEMTCDLVEPALVEIGVDQDVRKRCLEFVAKHGHLNAPDLLTPDQRRVFETSFGVGNHTIPWRAHVEMLGAITPFLTGSASKTINLPNSATVEDVEEAYRLAWRLGVKDMALYRDGSKATQALYTEKPKEDVKKAPATTVSRIKQLLEVSTSNGNGKSLHRDKLPRRRPSETFKFSIAGAEACLIVGYYPGTKRIGETFIEIYKNGTTVKGLMSVVGVLLSWCAQHGVMTEQLLEKLVGQSFEPQGFTDDPEIKSAKSPIDFVARKLLSLMAEEQASKPCEEVEPVTDQGVMVPVAKGDGDSCQKCGSITVPNGRCRLCLNCGESTGCG